MKRGEMGFTTGHMKRAVGGRISMQHSVCEGSSGIAEPRLIEWKGKRVCTLFSGQQGATEGSVIIIVIHWVN